MFPAAWSCIEQLNGLGYEPQPIQLASILAQTADPAVGTGRFSVEPIFGWPAVGVLAVITFASLWLTWTTPQISRKGRAILVGLRVAATIVLLLGWLRPALLSTTLRTSDGAVAVLMDSSLSMTLPSDSPGRSRWQVQRDVWRTIVDSTKLELGGSKIVPYFYDKQLQSVEVGQLPDLKVTLGSQPTGRITDLGAALAAVGKQQIDPPLRSVVLIGDGTQTQTPPASDPLMIARQMAQLDQPIYAIGLGPRTESETLRDVALETLPEEIMAFAKKKVGIPLVVASQGLQNQPIELRVVLRSAGKPDRELIKRQIFPTRPTEKIPVDYSVELEEAGDYLLEAEVKVGLSEPITSNNRSTSFLTVREGGVRILVLDGEPRAEQRFIRLSLDASQDFEVKYSWLQQRTSKAWPIDLDRQVKLSDFDIIAIGDLDSSAIKESSWSRIAARIKQGTGLLLLGGYNSFDAGGYQSTPLRDLIPIKMLPDRQPIGAAIDNRFHVVEDVKVKPTRPHPITTLLPEPENSKLWEGLPALKGMNYFRDVASSPGTQILLASSQGQAALVTGQSGEGRVLAFAGDSSWQWYMSGDELGHKRAHQTFWRQAMLWLVNRDKVDGGFRMSIGSRRQDIDAAPRIKIEWFGGSNNQAIPGDIKVALSRDGQAIRDLELSTTGPTLREVMATGLDQPGLYRARLTATGDKGKPLTAEVAFLVQDSSLELTTPNTDWRMLSNLVAAGQAAGSELFMPEDTGRMLERLKERQRVARVSVIERYRLGDTAWDSWLYFLIFCMLMTTEWSLRKRWQLP